MSNTSEMIIKPAPARVIADPLNSLPSNSPNPSPPMMPIPKPILSIPFFCYPVLVNKRMFHFFDFLHKL